uniref:Uncharacterized protein n=1 Tax=Anopheles atroparvus TaxID=41427 RepID=A0A182ISP6_ANOAO
MTQRTEKPAKIEPGVGVGESEPDALGRSRDRAISQRKENAARALIRLPDGQEAWGNNTDMRHNNASTGQEDGQKSKPKDNGRSSSKCLFSIALPLLVAAAVAFVVVAVRQHWTPAVGERTAGKSWDVFMFSRAPERAPETRGSI